MELGYFLTMQQAVEQQLFIIHLLPETVVSQLVD